MRNLFAWASMGEDGKSTGGKPGDQTGCEVKIGTLYDFGQDVCIRCFKKTARLRGAKYAKELAKNPSVGYSMSINQNKNANRNGLYRLAEQNDWNYTKLKKALKKVKVNTDCSAFASTIINLAFKKRMVGCCTTQTICDTVSGVGKYPDKFKVIRYVSAKRKFYKLDMPLKKGKHIIIKI